MNAYFPTGIEQAIQGAIILLVEILFGFAIQKNQNKTRVVMAWGLTTIGVFAMFLITLDQPPGFRMIVLILALLYGMKAVVATHQMTNGNALNFVQWIAYTVGWFGMRPMVFKKMGQGRIAGTGRLIRKGALRIILGFLLILGARFFWADVNDGMPGILKIPVALLLLMPGLSLVLHFGLFNVMAGFWRWIGVPVGNLFNAPFKARTLAEFWGRRWNIAFTEMTTLAIFRPLKARFGETIARTGAFVFSGLAHELAISVPVNAGYGLPTTYFGIQAVAMAYEKNWKRAGRIWTAVWVLLPLPLLFHPAFIMEIILPLIK
ncbi:MBOAT family protein [Rubellicoccus peritrichatus]|uniref:MBOAT family protein n=1 Tax=Rubellicoccus peritrichatus TaxID=3080537 RepID=A0AAQ3L673_9BACT|nr:MBOAT family protein [Puniceicoccus sp. CR14]WOO40025.1 MBOAT family protein [Puniceicoccus sp. CR14]